MKKAFLITFEITERVIMDVDNSNNLTETEENNICWIGREKVREEFEDKFILDNVSEITEDIEVPYGHGFGEKKNVLDYLKQYDPQFLCDFYNAYRDEMCGIESEALFNLRDYEDFYLIADGFGLEVAKECQKRGMYWVAGTGYDKPRYVGETTDELLRWMEPVIEDDYIIPSDTADRESMKRFIRDEYYS